MHRLSSRSVGQFREEDGIFLCPEDRKEGHYNPLPYEGQNSEHEQALRKVMMQVMVQCAAYFERLPLIQDVEILRNIIYSGVWMAWNQKTKKGCLRNGERSI